MKISTKLLGGLGVIGAVLVGYFILKRSGGGVTSYNPVLSANPRSVSKSNPGTGVVFAGSGFGPSYSTTDTLLNSLQQNYGTFAIPTDPYGNWTYTLVGPAIQTALPVDTYSLTVQAKDNTTGNSGGTATVSFSVTP